MTSRGCLSVTLPGVATGVRLGLHKGTLSYGASLGEVVRSTRGEVARPRLALLNRSAARVNRPEKELSFSLLPRLWLIVEERWKPGVGRDETSMTGMSDLSSSSSITISITPEPLDTPETIELVLLFAGRYKGAIGAGGGGGGIARC